MTLSSGPILRMLIIALAILIGLQMLIVGAGYLVRTAELAHPARPRIVEQIAAAVALIENTPPGERETAIRAINSPFISFSTISDFPQAGVRGMDRPLNEYRPIISRFRNALGQREFQIFGRRWRRFKGTPPVVPAEIIIAIKLADGTALIVEPSPEYRRQLAVNVAALTSSILGLLLLGGLVWASFQTTRPLREMAAAATRLASDLDAAPLAEQGPGPVRDLARSLNAMQGDLKRLMAERTVLLAAVAHDFRTYLTRLRLRADFIAEDEQRLKAEKDIDEMTALIEDTLLYARAGAARAPAAPFDVAALLRQAAEALRETGAQIDLVAPEQLVANGHEGFVRRAVVNLLDNAIKYGRAARARLETAGAFATLTIEDEGTSLQEADLERLSEPFFRIEGSRSRATGGAGLGLAISRRLVAASGGELQLDRTPAGGLRARIVLPAG